MDQLVTIRTFNNSSDLGVVKTYLESRGIKCYTKDEINNCVYIANVNGGAKLQVKEKNLEETIACLIEGGYLTKKDMDPSPEFKFIDKILSKFRK